MGDCARQRQLHIFEICNRNDRSINLISAVLSGSFLRSNTKKQPLNDVGLRRFRAKHGVFILVNLYNLYVSGAETYDSFWRFEKS